MWKTNIYEDSFQSEKEISIKKEKNTGRYFVFGKEGKRSPLIEVSFMQFIYNEYRIFILLILGISLIEVIAYTSYLCIAFAVLLEFVLGYLEKNHKICLSKTKNIYFYFRFFLLFETVLLLGYSYLNPMFILSSSSFIASLFLFNFYVYVRIYFYILTLKFHKIYQIAEYPKFYVWSEKC